MLIKVFLENKSKDLLKEKVEGNEEAETEACNIEGRLNGREMKFHTLLQEKDKELKNLR